MFRHLTSLGYQRTAGQAFGFYLFYLFAGILLIWATSYVVGFVPNPFVPPPTAPTSRASTSHGRSAGSTNVNLPGMAVETGNDGSTNVNMPGLSVQTAPDGSSSVSMPGMSVETAPDGTTSVSTGGIKTTTAPDGTKTVGPDWSIFGFRRGVPLKTTLGLIITAALALLVLRAKRQLANVGYVFVALVSVAGALVGGLLFGLIFVAFLTTQPTAGTADAFADQIPVGAAF
jgi:hypothetical protein